MMHNPFKLFKLKRNEVVDSLPALVLFIVMNAVSVASHFSLFTRAGRLAFWTLFTKHFEVSGFDPNTYIALSMWNVQFDANRHPLLSLLWWPPAMLNKWLMHTFHVNCAVFIVAVVLVLCAWYSFIFVYRTLYNELGIRRFDAALLSYLLFSMAYMLVTVIVPDHFALSLFLLTLMLWTASRALRRGRGIALWKLVLMTVLTGGVTLSNAAKVWIADVFVNRRKAVSVRHLVFVVVLPMALLMATSVWQINTFVKPHMARIEQDARKKAATDSAKAALLKNMEKEHKQSKHTSLMNNNIMKWSDVNTPRLRSVTENLFGEGIQLHRDYRLKDIYKGRPVFVSYRWAVSYVVEAIVVLLFLCGAWMGRKERIIQLALSFMAVDMIIHLGFCFGLNEVYIMSAHWMFVMPVCIAALFKRARGRQLLALEVLCGVLTLWLYAYNISVITGYML